MFLAAAVALVGCGGKAVNPSFDAGPLENSYKSADTATKAIVDKAVAAVKAANYGTAMVQLQKLVDDTNITPEQQKVVKGILEETRKAAIATAPKSAEKLPALPR